MHGDLSRIRLVPPPADQSHSPCWLSILIPVYRVERYLRACVESVVTHCDAGVEVLLLDDASPDRSGEIALELARAHSGIVRTIRRQSNGGLSAARNALLAQARGDYVWHVDSDDSLLPGAVERLRKVVATHSPDLVLCGFRIMREHPRLRERWAGMRRLRSFDGRRNRVDSDRSRLVAGLMRMRRMHAWSKIARRDVWNRARFPEGRTLMQDVAAMPQLIAATRTYVHVDEPWVAYRQHDQSALASPDGIKILHVLQTLKELRSAVRNLRPLDPEAEVEVDYFILRTFGWIARQLQSLGRSTALEQECRHALEQLFPGGCQHVFRGRQTWHRLLPAGRLQRRLRSRQWV
jgi:glycosyltransferase involved in cell wall biosynthesis